MSYQVCQRLEAGRRYELVRGEVVELMPPDGKHRAIAVDAGYMLAYNPDTVRGSDVSYVRSERIPTEGIPERF